MSAPLVCPSRVRHAPAPIALHDAMREDVLRGLRATRKTLPPKLFYDDTGARLFEEICELEEYYLTRAELAILSARAGDIAEIAGPRCALIEYGSGAGRKVRLLLDALGNPSAYVPVDISREQLVRVAADLAKEYPSLRVQAVCADYTEHVDLPPLPADVRRLAFFPGSTIGNFHPAEAAMFLRGVRETIGNGGTLVLGVDRRKDEQTLTRAYNDRAGITAAFNLNMLTRLNRQLDATFDRTMFRHRAFFNDAESRIEMHLECTRATVVQVAGEAVRFAGGETIWTESSYKYDERRLEALAGAAGFRIARLWTDAADQFWVAVLATQELGVAG